MKTHTEETHLLQTRVPEKLARMVRERAKNEGLSDAAFVRRLVMVELGVLAVDGTRVKRKSK